MQPVARQETPFGRYVLLHKLATGGMAEIFLARDAQGASGQLLVIKRILPHLGENQEFVQMFLDEARLAHHLQHPNVIALYDVGAVDDQYFIAMEYLRGMDLRRLMRKVAKRDEWIPLDIAVAFAVGAAEGLHHAHECRDEHGRPLGIVHRDVSPQNVFATVDGQVKVLDFGIAKAESRLTETRTGVLKGKYSYMSPEQASSGVVDRRSDVFALGVILFELLTNRRLFKRDNEILTLRAVIDDPIPPPSELRADVPPALDRIVLRALSRNPKARFASARALSEELQRWAMAMGRPPGPALTAPYVAALFADEPDPANATGRSGQGYVSFVRQDAVSEPDPGEPGSGSSRVDRIGGTHRSRRERQRAAEPSHASDDALPTFEMPARPLDDEGHLDAPTLAFRSYEEPLDDAARDDVSAVPPTLSRRSARGGFVSSEVPATAVLSTAATEDGSAFEARVTLAPPAEPTAPRPRVGRRWVLPIVAAASMLLALAAVAVWRIALAYSSSSAPASSVEPPSQTAAPRFGAIVVQTDVPAQVLVDGDPVGATPAVVPGVSIGRLHRVTVRAAGRELTREVVLQREGDTATVRFALGAAPIAAAGGAATAPSTLPPVPAGAVEPVPVVPTPTPAVASTPPVAPAPDDAARQARRSVAARTSDSREHDRQRERETHPTPREGSAAATIPGPEPAPRVDPSPVGVLIDSVPAASASVGGRSIGRTPARTTLTPGVHSVTLVDSSTMLRYTTRIEVGAGGYSGRIVVPTGRLRVNVLPWAEVYIEGRMRGTTPMPPITLYSGRYRIRLVNRDIGRDETVSVTVTPNGDARLSRSWQ